jgi:hypothetical protein
MRAAWPIRPRLVKFVGAARPGPHEALLSSQSSSIEGDEE